MKIECENCGIEISRRPSQIKRAEHTTCSTKCSCDLQKKLHLEVRECILCFKAFSTKKWDPKKFCNSSCAATYNNTHKTKGTRVSKLERYLQEVLPLRHNIEFKFNSKEEINSELDIYIPSLKLAFELNGIFHYEPVYGQDKLDKIINNDKRKFKACHEAGISLCVIDTTSQKKFTAESSSVFVVLIEQIIMEALEVVETSSVPSPGTILSS